MATGRVRTATLELLLLPFEPGLSTSPLRMDEIWPCTGRYPVSLARLVLDYLRGSFCFDSVFIRRRNPAKSPKPTCPGGTAGTGSWRDTIRQPSRSAAPRCPPAAARHGTATAEPTRLLTEPPPTPAAPHTGDHHRTGPGARPSASRAVPGASGEEHRVGRAPHPLGWGVMPLQYSRKTRVAAASS
ncbi:hypothetical protein SEVIR_5G262001v4 [Setaria viridis]